MLDQEFEEANYFILTQLTSDGHIEPVTLNEDKENGNEK